ncbi:MAG: hypothetical protein WC492_03700 [Candidatus Micrarchaeia archaeon]|jgi:hypothetical protein
MNEAALSVFLSNLRRRNFMSRIFKLGDDDDIEDDFDDEDEDDLEGEEDE